MTETATIRGSVFEIRDCITCGVVYAMPKVIVDQHRKSGGYASCPNGHQQGWPKGESEDDRIRRERDLLKQQMAQRDDELRRERLMREAAQADAREASATAALARKKLVKLKQRAATGTCPCCNRNFSELQKHIATKHPTFRAEDVAHENVVSIIKARA